MDTTTAEEKNDEVELLLSSKEASPDRSGKRKQLAGYRVNFCFVVLIVLITCYNTVTIVVIQSIRAQSDQRAGNCYLLGVDSRL